MTILENGLCYSAYINNLSCPAHRLLGGELVEFVRKSTPSTTYGRLAGFRGIAYSPLLISFAKGDRGLISLLLLLKVFQRLFTEGLPFQFIHVWDPQLHDPIYPRSPKTSAQHHLFYIFPKNSVISLLKENFDPCCLLTLEKCNISWAATTLSRINLSFTNAGIYICR